MKEKYLGKTVKIYTPNKSRMIDVLTVEDVIDNDCLYGTSELSGIETAYYLSDGIVVEDSEV